MLIGAFQPSHSRSTECLNFRVRVTCPSSESAFNFRVDIPSSECELGISTRIRNFNSESQLGVSTRIVNSEFQLGISTRNFNPEFQLGISIRNFGSDPQNSAGLIRVKWPNLAHIYGKTGAVALLKAFILLAICHFKAIIAGKSEHINHCNFAQHLAK